MEFVLRCNNLKCRAQLHDRAVVTTCSHVFCTECAEKTKLSRSSTANRVCPACSTQLNNPDDVVVTGLNPSEDYKTSVLSGLSPAIITECASRGLAFYSYQSSQEIIYQEYLAKSWTEKYSCLNQQLDQIVNEANSSIKEMQDRLQRMQADQLALEQKNHELLEAFRQKSRAQQQIQKHYQALKSQVMATQVAHAAGDEADLAVHTARGARFVDMLPGARSGTANLSQLGVGQHHGGGRSHYHGGRGSSGENGQPRGGVGLAPQWSSQLNGRGLGSRMHSGQSAPVGSPSQPQALRSRLPVLGNTRQNALRPTNASSYQPSPMARQPLGGEPPNNFGFGGTLKKSGGMGSFGR